MRQPRGRAALRLGFTTGCGKRVFARTREYEDQTYLRSSHRWVAPGCSNVRKVPYVPSRVHCQCVSHMDLRADVTYSS
jgi:hypothetical protein